MNNKRVLISASLGIFLCMLDTTIMNITLPAIQQSLGVELKDLSWALNVYTIIFASLTIPLTKLAELWGKERVFIGALILFMISSLLCGSSDSLQQLIFSRLLQGISASVLFPLSMIIGLSTSELENRDRTIAILGVTQGFAAAIGPTVGGVLSQFFSWHWVFLINVPTVLIALVLGINGLEFNTKSNVNASKTIDFTGSILSMVCLFAITTFLIQGSTWDWLSAKELALLLLGVIMFIIFIFYEKSIEHPMIPLKIFKNRMFSATSIVVILSNIYLIGMMVTLPSMLTQIYNFSELKAALLITPISIMIFIFSPISALLVKKIGPRLLMAIGFSVFAIGYVLISIVNIDSYLFLIMVCTIIGIGYGIIIGPATLLAASDFTGEMLTASQSIIGVVRQIGIVLGVAIFVTSLTANITTATTNVKYEVKDSSSNIALTQPEVEKLKQYQQSLNITLSEEAKVDETQLDKLLETLNEKQINTLQVAVRNVKNKIKVEYKNAYIKVYFLVTPFVIVTILCSFLFSKKVNVEEQSKVKT